MFEPSARTNCEICGAEVAETARICPHCNSARQVFRAHFNLCTCGEFNVHSDWPCWNCQAETAPSLAPDGPYFCRRCGHHSVGMGWMFCKFCWDYVAQKNAREEGIPVTEIPIYSDMWDANSLVRTPECGSCGCANETWRSFCIECGCYLVDKDTFMNG